MLAEIGNFASISDLLSYTLRPELPCARGLRLGSHSMLLVLPLLAIAALGEAVGSNEDEVGRRHTRENYPFGQSLDAPEYEIVIARYAEDSKTLAWLADLPLFFQVTIINKVSASSPPHGSKWPAIILLCVCKKLNRGRR